MTDGKLSGLLIRAVVCLLILTWALVGLAEDNPTNGQPMASPELPGRSNPGPITVGPEASSLRLIKFSGELVDSLDQPQTGVVGVTFSLYAEQEGGAPLWLETQNVQLNERGRYTALLGATQSEGLPLELFTSGEARWLGVQVQGQEEQARVLLVSVPYALRAAEADRLAGRDASEFVLTEDLESPAGRERLGIQSADESHPSLLAAAKEPRDEEKLLGQGTPDFIAKFIAPTTLGDSTIFESGSSVGIGTTAPSATLDVAGNGNFQADLTATNLFTGNVNASGVVSGTSMVASNGTINGPFSVTGEGTFGSLVSQGSVSGVSGVFVDNSTGSVLLATQENDTACFPIPPGPTPECPEPAIPTAIRGIASNTTGFSNGVAGINLSTTDFIAGVVGSADATAAEGAGITYGVRGLTGSSAPGAAGVSGLAFGGGLNVNGNLSASIGTFDGSSSNTDPLPNLLTVTQAGTGGAIGAFSSGVFSTIFARHTATTEFGPQCWESLTAVPISVSA